MNGTMVKRLAVGTLALTFTLCGFYISPNASARTASTAAQIEKAARDSKIKQQSASSAAEPRSDRRSSNGPAAENHAPRIVTEAASMLGMDENALLEQLKAGKSIAQIAQAKGIGESELTSKLLKLRIAHIDEAVKAGKLDAVKAETMKQRMGSHLTYMLNDKELLDRHMMKHKPHGGLKPGPEQLASMLGISKSELKAQLKAGKSLADIAAARGISREELMAKLKDQMTPALEQWIDRKHSDKAGK